MQAWKNWFSKLLNTVKDTQQNSDVLESSASYSFCLYYLMWLLKCASFKILSPIAIYIMNIQDRQCVYNIRLRYAGATIVTEEKQ